MPPMHPKSSIITKCISVITVMDDGFIKRAIIFNIAKIIAPHIPPYIKPLLLIFLAQIYPETALDIPIQTEESGPADEISKSNKVTISANNGNNIAKVTRPIKTENRMFL